MKLTTLLILLSALASPAFSQTPKYFKSAWTSGRAPAAVAFHSSVGRAQSIYTPSDFQGMPRGIVTNVYFRACQGSSDNVTLSNVQISLGYAADSVFTLSGGVYFFQTGLTLVYFKSTLPFTGMKTEGKWIKFTTNGKWVYDPTRNFVVDIDHGVEPNNNYGGFDLMTSNGSPDIRLLSGSKQNPSTQVRSGNFLDLGFDISPTEVAENSIIKSFGIFPNPSTDGRFVVSMETKGSLQRVSISVTNALGQSVYHEETPGNGNSVFKEIALNVPAGLYSVAVTAGGERITRNLTIQ